MGNFCHVSVKIGQRSKGQSATAGAAYRAGIKLTDERTGILHDYSKKSDVNRSEIITPEGAPRWAKDRDELWNKVELSEKRSDAQLYREVEVAIPSDVGLDYYPLVTQYVLDNFVSQGMIADVNYHDLTGKNPHAHIMLTMRDLSNDGTGFGKKNRQWNDRKLVEEWRADWSDKCNNLLDNDRKMDHRSYERQGIKMPPQIHTGPENRPGYKSKKKENDQIIIMQETYRDCMKYGHELPWSHLYPQQPKDEELEKFAAEMQAAVAAYETAKSVPQEYTVQLENNEFEIQMAMSIINDPDMTTTDKIFHLEEIEMLDYALDNQLIDAVEYKPRGPAL